MSEARLSSDIAPIIALAQSGPGVAPLRVWSLIVTLFGDAVVPRGGTVGVAAIVEVMAALGIEPGGVRTALSRLAADGWLERTRVGRNSFARLTPTALSVSLEATGRIYAAGARQGGCGWRLFLIDAPAAEQAAARALLAKRGAGVLGPNLMVLPDHRDPSEDPRVVNLPVSVLAVEEARRLVAAAFNLDDLARAYASFAIGFEPVRAALVAEGAPAGVAALALRVLIIHRLRRIVLRDPDVPASYLPADWPGHRARAIARDIWRAVNPAAEAWLDAHAQTDAGPLPPLQDWARGRFG